ncbi:MAG: deoxyguanosinetriphosphate triphosphohydrolase [Candidatus Omnitrophica bacterium]|nr:deoxyguanosinetriphosphate triphosphohydrolase [Candidatus Omnitrophota bacterium]
MKAVNESLATYAMKSSASRGRAYKEEEHAYRSAYQRDRDRIIHSTAFRRLEYKTQVFVNHEGDYYRTRLTHTLEVAQIARSIARALRLNEDLVEAIALAHDLGHTPFGHAGERALRELMRDHGGFDHNMQGLRVVDMLEEKYPDFPGLNLTWEVREAICKHVTAYDNPVFSNVKEFEPNLKPTLEAQVVDVSDEIAYDNHDIDDGITSGLLKEEGLCKDVPIWSQISNRIKMDHAKLTPQIRKYLIVRSLINMQVTDLIENSLKNLKKNAVKNVADARRSKIRLIAFSAPIVKKRLPLRDYLQKNLYQHYRVVRMSDKAVRFISDLFGLYVSKPEELPPTSHGRIKKDGVHRAVCDYIAGMTDRYALDEYKKLFDPYTKV